MRAPSTCCPHHESGRGSASRSVSVATAPNVAAAGSSTAAVHGPCARAVFSHENSAARARPRLRQSSARVRMSSTASTMASTEVGSNRRAPSPHTSGSDAAFELATGHPHAIALEWRLPEAFEQTREDGPAAVRYRRASSSRGTWPSERTPVASDLVRRQQELELGVASPSSENATKRRSWFLCGHAWPDRRGTAAGLVAGAEERVVEAEMDGAHAALRHAVAPRPPRAQHAPRS